MIHKRHLALQAILLLTVPGLSIGWDYQPAPSQYLVLVLTVNNAADAVDANPGDGVCSTITPGVCTLRAAIMEANAHPGPDTITFGDICQSCYKDTFVLTRPGPSEDGAATGDLDITDDLTIQGKAARRTIIDGGGSAVNDRVFHIDPGGKSISVAISDVTIQDGHIAGDGGGLLNDGAAKLTLSNVTFSSNVARYGGGLNNRSNYATVTLNNVTITHNRATQTVGGMANQGVAKLTDVIISDNTADGDTAGFFGGGVATLTNVTISNNVASGAAGGAFPGGLMLGGDTKLINTTISGNVGDPGAIWNGGRSTLTNVTISDNTGGISNCDNCGAVITLTNSIVSNSYFILNLNCYGTIRSSGHNLDSGNSCGFTHPGDLVNMDPLVGPLGYSVGRTPTLALSDASPAINAGDNSHCPSADQRGVARPQGPACDIGAYEAQSAGLIVNTTLDGVDAHPGDGVCETAPGNYICTLRAAIMEANVHPGPDKVAFGVDGRFVLGIAGANEDASATGDLDITEDLTLAGNGMAATVVDGGGRTLNDRVFHVHRAGSGISVFMSAMTIQNGNAVPASEGGGILNGDWLDPEPARLTLANSAILSNTVDGVAFASGGGIANNGILELDNVLVRGNTARVGGGINNTNATIALLNDAMVSGNRATDVDGGGIFNAADASTTLTQSTVVGNTADLWHGGGIANYGWITLSASTVSSNTAYTTGGGIWNRGNLSLINGTISENDARGTSGGGIWNSGTASLLNATLYLNSAGLFGGDLHNTATSTTTLKNTIVAGSLYGGNCSGAIISNGHNLDSGNSCALTAVGDKSNIDPLLGPLTDMGGSIFVHALLPGSPALDAGDNNGCPPTDQRGKARPRDDNGDGQAVCDMGAVEGATWLTYLPTIAREQQNP